MKRSAPIKRTALLRRNPPARTSVELAALKEGACAWCSKPFLKRLPLQQVCGPVCAGRKVRADRLAKEKAEREQTRERRQAAKTLRQLLAEVQVAFNAYIRARDAGLTCICCGKPFEPQKPGGSMDAGHYLGRGIAPQHRFNENNVFGQRKNCNRPGGTTRAAFRAGVIARIGLPAVEVLEADAAVPKWTREQLVAMKAHYRAKLRELERARATQEQP